MTRKSCVSVSHAVNNEGTVFTKLYSRPNTPQKHGEVHGVKIRWFQSGYHSAWPLSVKKGPERGGDLQASISGMGAPGPCCPTGHREVGGDLSCLDRKGWRGHRLWTVPLLPAYSSQSSLLITFQNTFSISLHGSSLSIPLPFFFFVSPLFILPFMYLFTHARLFVECLQWA